MKERKLIAKSETFTLAHKLSVVSATPLQEKRGETIYIIAVAMYEETNTATGEVKNSCMIVDSSGKMYGSISNTIMQTVSDMIEVLDDGHKITATVSERTSKGGRDYIVLEVDEIS